MPWTARCAPDVPDTVVISYKGVVGGAELRDATMAGVSLAQEHQATRYLVDLTAVTRLPRELNIFFLPATLYDGLGLDRRVVRAAVVSTSDDCRQLVHFYETACRNRGWQVKVFDAYEPAIAWLGVESGAV